MARAVSRAGENGTSTEVPVVDLGGTFEDHKPSAVDISYAKSPVSAGKITDKIETSNWIENLTNAVTNFNSPKGSFKLLAHGYHGSVQSIDDALRKDAFVLRAVQRKKIRFLTDDEAESRVQDLEDEPNESENHLAHLMESMDEKASERNSLYKIPLPDEAEQTGPGQTPAQIWADSNTVPAAPKNFRNHVEPTGMSQFDI